MNAKEEFLEITEGLEIKCVEIRLYNNKRISTKTTLAVNYTQDKYDKFLEDIDKEYDSGYGLQELYGTIWLKNGDWIDRYEYDGSERWELRTAPIIPNYLQSNEDIVTIDGMEYEFIEDDRFSCSHCSFRRTALCMTMKCLSKQRLDKKSGYFIKKEIK